MGIAETHPELNVQSVSLAAIQGQLERLLSCPSFQNSKRYPKFLKYVVEKGVSCSHEELKERVIGVEVFERPPDYEPAADPIVRLVAGETRKRLALYYLQAEHGEELRIEIPPGSYVPVFHWPDRNRLVLRQNAAGSSQTQPEEKAGAGLRLVSIPDDLHNPGSEPQAAPSRFARMASRLHQYRSLLMAAVAAVLLTASIAGAFWWIRTAPERQLKAFWAPMLSNNPSILICIGDWPNPTLSRNGRRYVGPYDLAAMARLAAMFNSSSHQFSILMASDVNLTDMRAGPAVLLGASNNKWTPTILANARYRYRTGGDEDPNYIIDTRAGENAGAAQQAVSPPSGGSVTEELALISRVASPETGQVELVLAGTEANGTVAASEFVTKPDFFKQFTDRAPRDWKDHNIQVLISTDVINGRSGPPHMVGFYLY